MLQLIITETGTAPVIICDHCGERITNHKAGIVTWDHSNPPKFQYLHKIRCDTHVDPLWEELGHHLCNLLHNVGLSFHNRAELEKVQERCDWLSRL